MTAKPPRPGQVTSPDHFCDQLLAYLTEAGHTQYDETVTQLEHGLQAAALAEADGHGPTACVAALLHDIGHLILNEHDAQGGFLSRDLHHEEAGARYLNRWFGPSVSDPVALHVKAKRYLTATEPAYAATLSAASTRSLQLQGGPMTPAEATAFKRLEAAPLAIALRRWDDRAKQPGATVPGLAHWRPAIKQALLPPATPPDPRMRSAAN